MKELRIESLEDIITITVEKVFKILQRDYVLVPKEECEELKTYDRKILETLKKFERPISLDHLSHETGIEKARLCKKLKTLEKFGKVRCVTKKVTSYWRITD